MVLSEAVRGLLTGMGGRAATAAGGDDAGGAKVPEFWATLLATGPSEAAPTGVALPDAGRPLPIQPVAAPANPGRAGAGRPSGETDAAQVPAELLLSALATAPLPLDGHECRADPSLCGPVVDPGPAEQPDSTIATPVPDGPAMVVPQVAQVRATSVPVEPAEPADPPRPEAPAPDPASGPAPKREAPEASEAPAGGDSAVPQALALLDPGRLPPPPQAAPVRAEVVDAETPADRPRRADQLGMALRASEGTVALPAAPAADPPASPLGEGTAPVEPAPPPLAKPGPPPPVEVGVAAPLRVDAAPTPAPDQAPPAPPAYADPLPARTVQSDAGEVSARRTMQVEAGLDLSVAPRPAAGERPVPGRGAGAAAVFQALTAAPEGGPFPAQAPASRPAEAVPRIGAGRDGTDAPAPAEVRGDDAAPDAAQSAQAAGAPPVAPEAGAQTLVAAPDAPEPAVAGLAPPAVEPRPGGDLTASGTAPGTGPPQAARPEIGMRAAEQVAAGLNAAADGRIELRLAPEELGAVRLEMTPADGTIAVQVVAERAETLDLLRRHADVLARELRQAGYGEVSFQFGTGADRGGGSAPRHAYDPAPAGTATGPDPAVPATAAHEPPVRRGTVAGTLDLRL